MKNTAYKLNPKTWAEYYSSESIKKKAKKFILGGVNSMPRSIFITGHSGCGKTTFALLLIRSIRCLDRPEDSIEPCGKCRACLDDDVRYADKEETQVYWIQSGSYEDETIKSQIKQAMSASSKGSRITDRIHRDMIFIVCDEWHTVPINVRQEFLQRTELEVAGNNVCHIFITMQEEQLPLQDRIAMTRRSSSIRVRPFNKSAIVEFLEMKFPSIPRVSAELIAAESEGSLGLAIAYTDDIQNVDPELSEEVVAHELSLATNAQRWSIWEALYNSKTYSYINFLIEGVSLYIDPYKLAKQMIRDILLTTDIIGTIKDDHLFAINLLTQYQSNHQNTSIVNYLAQLKGCSLVTKDAVFSRLESKLNYISPEDD